MSVFFVTGSRGLVGSAVVSEFHQGGFTTVGIDDVLEEVVSFGAIRKSG